MCNTRQGEEALVQRVHADTGQGSLGEAAEQAGGAIEPDQRV